MHDDALSPQQRRALRSLTPLAQRGFYLAGGTALCLRLAHRRSVDIDLFRAERFDPQQVLHDLRGEGVLLSNARTQSNTLWFEIEGVETSLMSFPYPMLEAPADAIGVPVASLPDIAAMKVEAISSRGARKDFVDLFFICSEAGLGFAGAITAFQARFASVQPDVLHRIKALTYFDDAEREPELLMLRPLAWSTVRSYFEREVSTWWRTAQT